MLYETKLRAMSGKALAEPQEQTDGKGLGVRISKAGRIRFQYRYKIKGRNKRLDLGYYPDLSLKQAREYAQECRGWLASGQDPKVAREMKLNKSLMPVTVKQALEYWLEKYAQFKRKNYHTIRAQFNKHVYPYIGHFELEKTEMSHWLDCFDRISNGTNEGQKPAPVAAGSVLQNCKQALKYCRVRKFAQSRELDDLTIDFVGKRANKRDRVLSTVELQELLQSIHRQEGSFYIRHICLLLLGFGARTQEVRLSTCDEWDMDNGLWSVPKAHNKTKTKIVRPIPPQLRPLIQMLLRRNAKSGYLLGELRSDASVSCSGSQIWKRLNQAEKWSLHDLRSTFSTKLNDLGVDYRVVEVLMGHAISGSEGHYNYSQYLNQSAEALTMWCDWIDRLVNSIDNVVDIGKAKAS